MKLRMHFGFWLAFALAGLPFLSAHALTREANTTLNLPDSTPVFGYHTVNAFPGVSLTGPLAIKTPPGETNRLFVVEKGGRIVVITNLANPNRTVFLDLSTRISAGGEGGLLGLAFHPGYATNGYFYIFHTLQTGTNWANIPDVRPGRFFLRDRISRFQVSVNDSNQADVTSEQVIISQASGSDIHNGGDIHFGRDGYLYVSLGDGGTLSNTQNIAREFFSGILRLDVDKRPSNLPPNAFQSNNPEPASTTNYFVPVDNPFWNVTNFNGATVNSNYVRTEFWAVGLRNPWRMSFDSLSGRLYVADVGQGTREEINLVSKGANFGWPAREGTVAGPDPNRVPANIPLVDPIQDYQRDGSGQPSTLVGRSVTGGLVYRGERLSQLTGAYVFADYVSGNIWMLRHGNTGVTTPMQHLATDSGIAGFGIDPRNGDVLMADLGGSIKRLEYTTNFTGAPLPPTLADVGAFSDLETLTTQQGIVPYELNVAFWSDHAHKQRWFSVPNTNLTVGFTPQGNWAFPTGMVWMKHFEMELTNGVPESARRLETRFIVRNTNGVYGITYRWNSPTNAVLVPEEGMDESLTIYEGDTPRSQVWRYPSRNECLRCHTAASGHALGFHTAQLNREVAEGEGVTNQIERLVQAGYFHGDEGMRVERLRRLAAAHDETQSLEYRVRSYLDANCSQCHQPGGGGGGIFDARIETATTKANLINALVNNTEGNVANRVIAPGAPQHSMILQRISRLGNNRMPPVGSRVVDESAVQLLTEWIETDLTNYVSFADWQIIHFGNTNAPTALVDADPDEDGAPNYQEYLTATNPNEASEAWGVSVESVAGNIRIQFPHLANRAFELQTTTDLSDPNSWQTFAAPNNSPHFPAAAFNAVFEDDASSGAARYYRVRVIEP